MPRTKRQSVAQKQKISRAYHAKRRANASSPQKRRSDEAQLLKDRNRKREMRANLKEEEREKNLDAARLRLANLSEEKRALRRQKDAERKRLKRAELRDKELALRSESSVVTSKRKPRKRKSDEIELKRDGDAKREMRGNLTEEGRDKFSQNQSWRRNLTGEKLALYRQKDAERKRLRRAQLPGKEALRCQKERIQAKERQSQLNEEQLALLRKARAARCRKYRQQQRLSEEHCILNRILNRKHYNEKRTKRIESTTFLFKGQSPEETDKNTLGGETSNVDGNDEETLLQIKRLKMLVTSLKEAGMELIKSCAESLVGKNTPSNEVVRKGYKYRKPDRNRHKETFPIIPVGGNNFVCIVCNEELNSLRAIKLHLAYHTASELSGAKEKYAQTIGENSRKMQAVVLTIYECEICSDKCYSLPTYRKHLVENHKENVELLKKICFPCTLCPEAFVVKSALKTHQRILHNIFYQCPVCSESFESQDLFAKHVEERHVDSNKSGEMILEYDVGYFCKLCGVYSRSHKYVTKHVKEAHSDISFECELCNLKFETRRILVRHNNNFHEEKPFCCEICGERFGKSVNLRLHKRKHTATSATDIRTEEKIDCKLCEKKFNNKESLRFHYIRAHEQKQFQCTICGKTFSRWYMLHHHKRYVCEKEKSIARPCSICGKILENYMALYCHRINIHKYGNSEESVCHVCSKTLKNPQILLSHNRTCHGKNKNNTNNQNSKKYESYRKSQKLSCSICEKTLKTRTKLLDHWRMHRDDVPFKCSFCDLPFKCKYKFYYHRDSTHENETAQLIIDSEIDEKLIADFNEAHANLFLNVVETNRTIQSTTEAQTNNSLSQSYVDFSRANVPVSSNEHQRTEDNSEGHETIIDDNIQKPSSLSQENKDANVENELMESDDDVWEPFEYSSPMASPLPEPAPIIPDSNVKEDEKPFIYPEGSDLKDPFPKRLTVEIERLKECLLCDELFPSSHLYKQHLNSKGHRLALRTNKRENILIETKKEEYREKIGKEKDRKKIRKGKGKFSCPFCDEKLHSVSEYLKHTAKHKKKENCIICSEVFSTVRKLVDHYFTKHNGENVIKCEICDMGFLDTKGRNEHTKNIHTKIKKASNYKSGRPCPCDMCGEKMKDYKTLRNHLLSHENDKHKCVHCAAEFKVLIEFEQHYKEVHNGEMPFPCGDCHEKFATQLRLQQHESICKDIPVPGQVNAERSLAAKEKAHQYYYQNKEPLTCSFCDAKYWNKRKFKAHMVQHNKRAMCLLCPEGFADVRKLVNHYIAAHNGEKLVKCEICDLSFLEYQMRNLRDHMADQHDYQRGKNWRVPQTYPCDVCGVICEGKKHHISHLLSHEKEKHKCVHCKSEIKGLEALENHYNETHNGEMPFPCGECPLKFPIQRRLQLHQKETHPESNDTHSVQFGDNNEMVYHKTIQDPLEAAEKVFCEICGKFFFGEASLTIHKREHTGENPYQCTLCGKTFFSPAILKQHMNKDHKKVCHPCDTCGKFFNRRQNLVKHSKTCFPAVGLVGDQTGVTCDICSVNFGNPEALERHLKFHDPARRFGCDICSWRFKNNNNLWFHKNAVHYKKGKVIPKV